jgi:hypothetical protein
MHNVSVRKWSVIAMRSVFVCLFDTNQNEVGNFLNQHYRYTSRQMILDAMTEEQRLEFLRRVERLPPEWRDCPPSHQWNLEVAGDTYLYIYFDNSFGHDLEPEELEKLIGSLGGKPDVVLGRRCFWKAPRRHRNPLFYRQGAFNIPRGCAGWLHRPPVDD